MRRLFTVLVAATMATLLVPVAGADAPTVVSGGGAGTFAADLDGDGDVDGSHFGLGAVFQGASLRPHFECLMGTQR